MESPNHLVDYLFNLLSHDLPVHQEALHDLAGELDRWRDQLEIHTDVAAIHAFRDGNGRVARVLSSLAMYRGGFMLPEFTSRSYAPLPVPGVSIRFGGGRDAVLPGSHGGAASAGTCARPP